MKRNTYIVEQLEPGGSWRLVVFEYPHKDMPDCRCVERIVEAEKVDYLVDEVDDIGLIERFSAHDKHLMPVEWQRREEAIQYIAKLTYIQDCYQAVQDAEMDLAMRKLELANAIQGDYNV